MCEILALVLKETEENEVELVVSHINPGRRYLKLYPVKKFHRDQSALIGIV
jgi:hypothetical protein